MQSVACARARCGVLRPAGIHVLPSRGVHLLRLASCSASGFQGALPLRQLSLRASGPSALRPPDGRTRVAVTAATADSALGWPLGLRRLYRCTPAMELPRRRAERATGSMTPDATAAESGATSRTEEAKQRKKGSSDKKAMLDHLLAEYQDMKFLSADDVYDDHNDEQAKPSADARDKRSGKEKAQRLPHSSVSMTLDDLLMDYDNDGEHARDTRGNQRMAKHPDPHSSAHMHPAASGDELSLDDLLAEYDGGETVPKRSRKTAEQPKATSTKQSAASGNRWTSFEGDFTLDDLLAAEEQESSSPQRDRMESSALKRQSRAEQGGKQADRESWQDEWEEDMSRFGGPSARQATMEDLVKIYQPKQANDARTTKAEIERTNDKIEEGRSDDLPKDSSSVAEDELLRQLDELENEEDEEDVDEVSTSASPDEEGQREEGGEDEEEEEARHIEKIAKEQGGLQAVHPLEFSPLWIRASKNLPPRRTEEEWQQLGKNDIEPAFADIQRSEYELEGVEVLRRYDDVDEDETDEQYMERMLKAAEVDEEFVDGVQGEPARKTKEAEALDAAEAKKAKKKLKRKERRKLEQQELMEKVRRNHKDANVKLIDSQMFAHGSNVPPELMHWFSDPTGIKTKRDVNLEKKCRKLQRMAELRKTREKRIDLPGDPSTAEVEELLGLTRRQRRMASKIHEHLENVLYEDMQSDAAFSAHDISISDVVMSRDMRIARVYWRGSDNEDAVERLLFNRSAMLRSFLARRARVRFAPELVFYRESAEGMYHEVSRYMDKLEKEEGWDEATIKNELKRIRKEREAKQASKYQEEDA